MGALKILALMVMFWVSFISTTHELQTYQRQVLLQLRKHLEYPLLLDVWETYNADLCNYTSSPHMSITCEGDLITELKIIGDKPVKVSEFNGFAVPNQTLSQHFSIDSFVVTLTRLTSLRVLSLVSLGIWGPLPDKIHRFSSLEVLDLSWNFMFGSIPFKMSRLVKLHVLTLDGNFFNDTMPDWFGSFQNLTILSLKTNRLKGHFPSSLSKLRALTDVIFSHNMLSGKLPDMSALLNLHLLDLRENQFESQLPPLPKGLTTILLSNNTLSGEIPENIGALKQLQHLDLSNNFLSGTPPDELFSLPDISYLNLASNLLSGSLSDRISCGEALGFVDISSNRLVGKLPSCLDTTSEKRIVRSGGNCLSVSTENQHPESYCAKKELVQGKHSNRKRIAVLVGVVGGIAIVVVLLAVGFLLIFRQKHHTQDTLDHHTFPKIVQDAPQAGISSELLANARIISQAAKLGSQGAPAYRVFSIEELQDATKYFDKSALLGEGSMGKIYKGKLENGTCIAIRLLALHKRYLIRNLKVRLDLLSKFSHPNLVSLLGHCIDGGGQDDLTVNRLFLVYEFIPNGNFRTHLSEMSSGKVLTWSERLAVLIHVAKAVHFLHTGVIPASFSNRLKTHNILLDEHHIAKLSDYGMSIFMEESNKVEGKGEVSNSWYMTKKEDDVYNFGFILLESLVGPITSGKGEAFLLNEMASFGSQDGRRRIVDPVVLTTSSQESLSVVISITNKCISPESATRPSFEDVLWNLQYAAQIQATADAEQKSDATSKPRSSCETL